LSPSGSQASDWPDRLATLALFLVPGLALWLQSGYSYGAALLGAGALLGARRWLRAPQSRWTWAYAVVMLGMALLWWLQLADPAEHWGQWDRPAKYALGAACLLFASRTAPRPRAQFWGLVLGCVGAGAVALWQVYWAGIPRATGFPSNHTSNAIQCGNLALLMAAMLALQLLVLHRHLGRWTVAAACVAVLLAIDASVLSQSRGGWAALGPMLPVGLYLLWRHRPPAARLLLAGTVLALAAVGALNYRMLDLRWNLMDREVQTYGNTGKADNSVGQRLEHWRFAWQAGLERPVLGWSMRGYLAEKEKRVAAGQYQSSILLFQNSHNELLDMFVKAGLAGVAWLLLLYGVPLCMFWPTRARMAAYAAQPEEVQAQVLALRLGGVCIPVLYAGFGMTVVFLGPNNGIMFYLFMTMLTWAALQGMDRRYAQS
jgi:O-antigen ligase